MRLFFVFALFLALGGTSAMAAPPAAPAAKPAAGAIIPGSPLAALTAAATQPGAAADTDSTAPFVTDALGFSLSGELGDDVRRSFGDFTAAVQASTRLTPVWGWLESFISQPARRAALMDAAAGLALTLLPAMAVDAALRLALRRPRAYCAARAGTRRESAPPPDDEAVQGLADAEAGETEPHSRRRDSLRAWGWRLIFALANFALALLPLLGFTIVLGLLIGAGLLDSLPALRAVNGVANAYLLFRLGGELVRFVLAPQTPGLRLFAMPGARAAKLARRAYAVLATVFAGFVLISVAEVLGLPHAGAAPLTRLVTLAVHVEIALLIWESRHVVGRWLTGPRGGTGALAAFRQRLGAVWHYFALFYVMALWVAWAGGVQNALIVMLRVVLVLLAALIAGRMLWLGSELLLERVFFGQEMAAGMSSQALRARVRAYHPLLRGLAGAVIVLLIIFCVLQGWGVNAFGWLLGASLSRSLFGALAAVIVTIAVALALWEAVNLGLHERVAVLDRTGRTRQASRLRTLSPMLRAAAGTVIFVITLFICLSKIGVNAPSLAAGAGVVGIAIGFGSQKLVQDLITGLFLLAEDAMQVGDYVSLGGLSGTVEHLSIRTIRLRGSDGSVNIIPFSSVSTVTNMTRDFGIAQISIRVAYGVNVDKVFAVLADISRGMRAEPRWGEVMREELQVLGLDEFGTLGLVVTGQIRTGPGKHWSVRREFYRRVLQRFDAEAIAIPYDSPTIRLEMPEPEGAGQP